MKLWIPTLLMLALFVWATVWQSHWTAELREHRDEAWERAAAGPQPSLYPGGSGPQIGPLLTPEGRSIAATGHRRHDGTDRARVLVGRPSGAAPIPAPEPPPTARGRFLQAPIRADEVAPAFAEADVEPGLVEPAFTMEVRGGQSLSVICQQHYGSARPRIVQALAAYNGLASPDKIRKGQTLHLPRIDTLLESCSF